MVTDVALLSSVAALTSVTLPESVHRNMVAPLRWMTSPFTGGGVGDGNWWRLPGGLDVSSTAAFCAGRR